MLNSQVYVVNSPELVLAVQRHPKTVSFWFIEAKFTAILGGMSRSASDKLLEHVEGTPGTRSLLLRHESHTHSDDARERARLHDRNSYSYDDFIVRRIWDQQSGI